MLYTEVPIDYHTVCKATKFWAEARAPLSQERRYNAIISHSADIANSLPVKYPLLCFVCCVLFCFFFVAFCGVCLFCRSWHSDGLKWLCKHLSRLSFATRFSEEGWSLIQKLITVAWYSVLNDLVRAKRRWTEKNDLATSPVSGSIAIDNCFIAHLNTSAESTAEFDELKTCENWSQCRLS